VPAVAHPNGVLALSVAVLKLMFVLLHAVEDVRETAVEHSFCAKVCAKGIKRSEHKIINNLFENGYIPGVIAIGSSDNSLPLQKSIINIYLPIVKPLNLLVKTLAPSFSDRVSGFGEQLFYQKKCNSHVHDY
jgi:hypothetical protein